MKKVCFVHFSVNPGGIEVLLPGIIKNLGEFKFISFVIRKPKLSGRNIYDGTQISRLYFGGGNILAPFKLFLFALHHRNLQFHVFNIGPIFLFILRTARVKNIIYSIHGTKYWKKKYFNRFKKALWHYNLRKNVIVTSNSSYSASVFKKEVKNISIQPIYNPFDISKYQISKKASSDHNKKLKIVYLGRLAKGKNLKLWIDIAANIINYRKDIHFEIWGIGPLHDELNEQIIHLGLEEKIILKGFSSTPEKVYQSSDLILFLSEYESFGNVAVESILCGTPVICSAIPSMTEIFADHPEFLVSLDENIKENVVKKINDLGHLQKKAQELTSVFRERFSAAKHYQKLRELYQ